MIRTVIDQAQRSVFAAMQAVAAITVVTVALLSLPSSALATADDKLSVQQVQTLALEYMQQQAAALDLQNATRTQYSAAGMDPRLSFSACESPLRFEPQTANARSGRTLVKVRCEDTKPWAIYVPLKREQWRQVVTAKRSIGRNTVIEPADIEIREQKLQGIAAEYAVAIDTVAGLQSNRPIAAGSAINTRHLLQPKWVRRGDEVVIVANSMGVSAKMPGTAMGDGRKNQQIQVRNTRSKRVIKARVIAPGTVEALM